MEPLIFETRADFRAWLENNAATSEGVWLLFGKKGGPQTLSANDALEEALCFGWIDGQMQRMDDTRYRKYFARRTPQSNWSQKNKQIAEALMEQGRMTVAGQAAIEAAKQDGRWQNATRRPQATPEQVAALVELLKPHKTALEHYRNMSPSVQGTYAMMYLDAKSEQARQRRLEKIVDRLNQNLKPM